MNSGDQSDGNGSGVIVTPRWFGELFQFLTTVNKLMVQITNHAREPLINLWIMAHFAFDSRATIWTGS